MREGHEVDIQYDLHPGASAGSALPTVCGDLFDGYGHRLVLIEAVSPRKPVEDGRTDVATNGSLHDLVLGSARAGSLEANRGEQIVIELDGGAGARHVHQFARMGAQGSSFERASALTLLRSAAAADPHLDPDRVEAKVSGLMKGMCAPKKSSNPLCALAGAPPNRCVSQRFRAKLKPLGKSPGSKEVGMDAWDRYFDGLGGRGWGVRRHGLHYWLTPPWDDACVVHGVQGDAQDLNRLRWLLFGYGEPFGA